jgi:NAD(P)H-hydrate epimerase
MTVRVASASETVACERATMAKGISSAELMSRAGQAAAREIQQRCSDRLGDGVLVYAGSGNNGGDGWVVAESLVKAGIPVEMMASEPRSHEAAQARDAALSAGVSMGQTVAAQQVVVDALLGTGSSGIPRGNVATSINALNNRRKDGAFVVALDVPSGLDSTTGEHQGSVAADLTISFGTMKRGHLISRATCGEIVVVDIGLTDGAGMSSLPMLVDAGWVHSHIPPIQADAHKGTRKRLAVVGGGPGMAGATILCGEGALRSGIGLLRIVAAPVNAVAVHAALPAALFMEWPTTPSALEKLSSSSDVIAIGPGLGNSPMTRDLVERILLAWSGPVVIDADALNVFAGDVDALATLLKGRPSIITPHPAEMSRLIGVSTEDVLANRFDVGADLAKKLGGAVLLKGTPTVVFSSDGSRYASAAGTAALATGGSGDVLTGIASTLLAQMTDKGSAPAEAAACAAFIHGRAAELCEFVRGTTLDDILGMLPLAWNETPPVLTPGILGEVAATQ